MGAIPMPRQLSSSMAVDEYNEDTAYDGAPLLMVGSRYELQEFTQSPTLHIEGLVLLFLKYSSFLYRLHIRADSLLLDSLGQ